MTTIFVNSLNLSHDVLALRFSAYHPDIRFSLFVNQQGDNPPINLLGFQNIPNEAGLQDSVVETLLNTPVSALETAILACKKGAIGETTLVGQFKTSTGQQAANYVVQQITNDTTEAQALAAFDNAATFAAAKPILRNMLIGMYRTVDILKLMARLLVAIRNYILPELQEL